jgi:hypothetical protein
VPAAPKRIVDINNMKSPSFMISIIFEWYSDIFNLTTALTDFIKEQRSAIQYFCIKTMEIIKEWQLRVAINA